ncbi:hypothetical protein SAMN06313486_10166 [Epsilonproteobacteria bacterium SCGC AD-308-P11]|nr:hypothetical protein SAMN06313486_10166 [Epsilonproteobacteria bacterium SCGC AD-308-P11]
MVNNLDNEISDDNIYVINQSILDGNEGGTITQDGNDFNWKIETYLSEKVEILKENDEVVFEHNQFIHQIFLNSEGEYEYNSYSFDDFISGDELEPIDGGGCTGTAHDAVFMAIGE